MNKITKHHTTLKIIDTEHENLIFSNVSEIIESRKFNAISVANSQIVLILVLLPLKTMEEKLYYAKAGSKEFPKAQHL